MEPGTLLLVGAVFLLAGAVKGISGMGLPTVSMALLGLFLTPAAAAALMVGPSLATNLAQCAGPHWRTLGARLWPLWLALALATVFSPLPDLGTSGPVARVALGAVLIAYGVWGLARPALPDLGLPVRPAGAVAGALTGMVTAATGIFVIPLVPYVQTLRLDREQLIQALGLSFMVATLALAARLGRIGAAPWSLDLAPCAVALVAAFAGLWLGARWRRRLRPVAFQRALFAVFVLLGAAMLARAL
ncbi:MAG: sulfite exporter TauE/SafE family protein [Rubritepida sp.]|jgi:hypothetical protein|nr:sulfite exporter TauE/SafE family protein [Rubritepida sp.]